MSPLIPELPADLTERRRQANKVAATVAATVELRHARELAARIAGAGDALARVEQAAGTLETLEGWLDQLTDETTVANLEALSERLADVKALTRELVDVEAALQAAHGTLGRYLTLVERIEAVIPAVDRIERLVVSLDRIKAIQWPQS